MNRKTFVVELIKRTDADALSCADGEVERHYSIPWLEEDEGNGSAASKKRLLTRFSADVCASGMIVPASARALTFHSPEMEGGEREFLVYALPGGGIGYSDMSGAESGVSVGPLPAELGDAVKAHAWRDLVVLQCPSGVAWLLYEGSGNYRLLTSLPEAPAVDFALDAAHLEGYTRLAGSLPEMEVEADLHDIPDLVDAKGIAAWLDEGHALRVDEIVKRRVYEAVAKRVALYMDDVAAAGMFAGPVACVASFGGALPTATVTADSSYSAPYAKLLSWSVDSVTISLRIQFSLAPMQLSATFSLTTLQKRWRRIFRSLDFGIGENVRWWIPSPTDKSGRPVVSAYNSLSQASGGGFAFRFRARSRASLLAEVQSVSVFSNASSVDVSEINSGTVILSPVSDKSAFRPDYTDFQSIVAKDSALTDEGVLLWNDRTLLTPMKGNGVIYRYREILCDSTIVGVTQGASRRSVSGDSRHPLFVFCKDGVRQFESGEDGGYRNSRMVSRIPVLVEKSDASDVDGRVLSVHVPAGIAYLSAGGVELLSYSGSVKSLCRYPEDLNPVDLIGLYYHHPASVLLLAMADGSLRLFDLEENEWVSEGFSVEGLEQDFVQMPSGIWCIGDDGGLSELSIGRKLIEVDAEDGEDEGWNGAQIPGRCGLVTRPMKFGDPFVRKRIRRICFAIPVDFAIEGSDDLEGWRELATGTASRNALHTVACRYLRLRILADSQLSPSIRHIRLSIQFVP